MTFEKKLTVFVLGISSVVTSSPAIACDRSPDLVQIPGTTGAEHSYRYEAFEKAKAVLWAFNLETAALEDGWRVYLAKVESVRPSAAANVNRTLTARPVWQVRGILPKEAVNLKEEGPTSCPSPGGVWNQKPGDLVVVFEEPGKTSAWRASDVRTNELIDAISMYALSLGGEQN